MKQVGKFAPDAGEPQPVTERNHSIAKFFYEELAHLIDPERDRLMVENQAALYEKTRERLDSLRGKPSKKVYQVALQEMRKFYDELGEGRDIASANLNLQAELQLMSFLANCLEDSDRLVIDAGCGTGIDLCALADLFPDKRFIGYDLSQGQIELARERVSRRKLENIQFYVGTHERFPATIKPGSVDMVYIKNPTWVEDYFVPNLLVEILSSPQGIQRLLRSRFQGIRGVLKDNGTLVSMGEKEDPDDTYKPRVIRSPDVTAELPGFNQTGFTVFSVNERYFAIASYQKTK